ncbi:FtsW/RodA/SpoVE family cell cycle protein [Desulforamulus ruminis]|uniref:FtsW/RodA/SpoVE family cell cycle protein n=1 Tax=Desulforamulus ruminis TaxID=1564 RepID=UPI00030F236C|nr:FtsW/RodA/SpoVE family cell cycle protein [Desulforamulus ruminis]
MFVIIGISVTTALYYFDYTRLKNISTPIYISGILLLVTTMLTGIEVNGVKGGFQIGNYHTSSPELASLLFLIGFVGFLEKYRGKGAIGILKLIIQSSFSVFLLIMMPSVSTAFVMTIAYGVVFITAIMRNHFGENKKIQLISLCAGGVVPAALFAYSIIANPYKLNRFALYFSRGKEDPSGVGYLQYMAKTWLSISNWFGKTKATYQGQGLDMTMPNVTGQYVLINVIATLGWAAGIILILLIGIFIVRMIMTINKIKNCYGFYLSLSVCTILSAQFLINILMNFNLFPLMSFNMPFVSYGGTGYVISMALVGIILSVWRRNNLILYKNDILTTSPQKSMVIFSDGKLTIDLMAWKQ